MLREKSLKYMGVKKIHIIVTRGKFELVNLLTRVKAEKKVCNCFRLDATEYILG